MRKNMEEAQCTALLIKDLITCMTKNCNDFKTYQKDNKIVIQYTKDRVDLFLVLGNDYQVSFDKMVYHYDGMDYSLDNKNIICIDNNECLVDNHYNNSYNDLVNSFRSFIDNFEASESELYNDYYAG